MCISFTLCAFYWKSAASAVRGSHPGSAQEVNWSWSHSVLWSVLDLKSHFAKSLQTELLPFPLYHKSKYCANYYFDLMMALKEKLRNHQNCYCYLGGDNNVSTKLHGNPFNSFLDISASQVTSMAKLFQVTHYQ